MLRPVHGLLSCVGGGDDGDSLSFPQQKKVSRWCRMVPTCHRLDHGQIHRSQRLERTADMMRMMSPMPMITWWQWRRRLGRMGGSASLFRGYLRSWFCLRIRFALVFVMAVAKLNNNTRAAGKQPASHFQRVGHRILIEDDVDDDVQATKMKREAATKSRMSHPAIVTFIIRDPRTRSSSGPTKLHPSFFSSLDPFEKRLPRGSYPRGIK